MRVAVYGGSFNPPHIGHALVVAWLVWTRRADEVWLLPTYAHAFDKPLAPWPKRLRACEALARLCGPRVRVEPIESELPTPSYTWLTLQTLAARHPQHHLHLVVGADVLGQTPSWRAWEEIRTHHAPIVVGRAGHPPVEGAPTFPDVSSTEVRARLAAGLPVDHLVPAEVLEAWQD